tara:strand:- start:247 stop:681 length:435 start_codon:yes stop_codon:yes gene_type:complete
MGEIMIFGETKFFVNARRGLAKFALAAMVCLVAPQAALAEEVSAEAKAKAQLTLAQWMKDRSDDSGKFYFVDRQANELVAGYSANVHPMIVPYKDGAIFVCSEVVTENGDRITADFLTVPVGDGYKIVEVIMNNRPSVKKMMGM